jgi:hypothetical protein
MTMVIHSCALRGSRGLPRNLATDFPVSGSSWQDLQRIGEPSAIFTDRIM